MPANAEVAQDPAVAERHSPMRSRSKHVMLYAALAVAAVVGVFLVVVTLLPAEFSVARKTTISGPPAAVFAQVNDFHKWEAWNPWGKIDPAMKQTYDGATAGT